MFTERQPGSHPDVYNRRHHEHNGDPAARHDQSHEKTKLIHGWNLTQKSELKSFIRVTCYDKKKWNFTSVQNTYMAHPNELISHYIYNNTSIHALLYRWTKIILSTV